jgi:phosphonopyruvate decarboxylase
MVVTWRGQPGRKDEPQHELMGQITGALLDTVRIRHGPFPPATQAVGPALEAADLEMNVRELPYAFIMPEGSVRDEALVDTPVPAPVRKTTLDLRENGALPSRAQVLERVLAAVPESVPIVATTGKTGRELFTLADRPQHLYLVGSMGCASGVGLGIALNTERRVVVLDGDGAALMKLGTMATIGAMRPKNLVHVLLNNGVHDSTGGQATSAPAVDFVQVALAAATAARRVAIPSLGSIRRCAMRWRRRGRPWCTLGSCPVRSRSSAGRRSRPTTSRGDFAAS